MDVVACIPKPAKQDVSRQTSGVERGGLTFTKAQRCDSGAASSPPRVSQPELPFTRLYRCVRSQHDAAALAQVCASAPLAPFPAQIWEPAPGRKRRRASEHVSAWTIIAISLQGQRQGSVEAALRAAVEKQQANLAAQRSVRLQLMAPALHLAGIRSRSMCVLCYTQPQHRLALAGIVHQLLLACKRALPVSACKQPLADSSSRPAPGGHALAITVQVRAAAVGELLGVRGARLQALRAATGAGIVVSNKHAAQRGRRAIQLTGNTTQMLAALLAIQAVDASAVPPSLAAQPQEVKTHVSAGSHTEHPAHCIVASAQPVAPVCVTG